MTARKSWILGALVLLQSSVWATFHEMQIEMLSGGVDQIAGVVRVGAFINSDATFTQQPHIADAASELLTQIFGDAGKHARAAVAVNGLPRGSTTEVQVVVELR